MAFKHYSAGLMVQAILLGITPLLFAYVYNLESNLTFQLLLGGMYLIQVVYLIRSVRKSNWELARFVESFEYNDSTMHFNTSDRDSSLKEVYQSFNKVIEAFRLLKLEKEKEYQFFETAIKSLGVAIMVINEKGSVLMSNKALLELFNVPYIHRMEKLDGLKPGLVNQLLHLLPRNKELIEVVVNERLVQMAVTAVIVKQDNRKLKLLAFQDIRGEIEQKELESWQKLIRVLSHEVMNSLSPINILTAGMMNRLNDEENWPIDISEKEDMLEALEAIQGRSKGLTRFVKNYRSLTGLNKAQATTIDVEQLLNRTLVLFQDDLLRKNIKVEQYCNQGLKYHLDEKLTEQVLINLVKNSVEAMEDNCGQINLKATLSNGHLHIVIADNGKGIPKDELDKVCVPFYTTRAHGNGIGLALSRQVMRLHGGQLKIQSKEGKGTKISLIF